jgi:hypothetical protein
MPTHTPFAVIGIEPMDVERAASRTMFIEMEPSGLTTTFCKLPLIAYPLTTRVNEPAPESAMTTETGQLNKARSSKNDAKTVTTFTFTNAQPHLTATWIHRIEARRILSEIKAVVDESSITTPCLRFASLIFDIRTVCFFRVC